MATGPIILAIFAAIWAISGLVALQMPLWVAVLAAASSIAIGVAAMRLARALPPRREVEERRIGRLVGIWSAIEGVAIFLGIMLAVNLGRPELNAAVMCTAVGLHFFPLAYGIPRKSLYVSGIFLTTLGLCGLFLGRSLPTAMVDLAAAAGLWLTALLGLADMRRIIRAQTKL